MLICAPMAVAGRQRAVKSKAELTIAEVTLRSMEEHVTSYYVDPISKEPTTEQVAIKHATCPLNRLFATLPARALGRSIFAACARR